MKNVYILLALLIIGNAFGQIEQNVNKITGTESNAINGIDSIRFNANQTQMQIILNNGSTIIHAISDINNVTFSGQLIGEVDGLDCAGVSINGALVEGVLAIGVSANISYTGGNASTYAAQSIFSTGVTGLTATLPAGNFANGNGSLTYSISGTPSSSGIASFTIILGGQACSFSVSVAPLSATITTINCVGAITSGTLVGGIPANSVSVNILYTGGNAGAYGAQSVSSTGVLGLTATLPAGNLANGNGSVTYSISGTPSSSGIATFAITLGGQACSFTVSIAAGQPQYPNNSVFCAAGPAAIVDVTNPITNRVWMNRNLGASQVATSSTDQNAYGDLYQWGRRTDGHQCRTSPTILILSSVDQPAHGDFILVANAPDDWRSPQNANLWQGINGINNPCPTNYRLPTEAEFAAEYTSWSTNNANGAFLSPLKWTLAGARIDNTGLLSNVGAGGYYWSSTVIGTYSRALAFGNSNAYISDANRVFGLTVRCIKN